MLILKHHGIQSMTDKIASFIHEAFKKFEKLNCASKRTTKACFIRVQISLSYDFS